MSPYQQPPQFQQQQHPALQQQQQQPQFSAYEHAIFTEIIRAVCHVIAKDMHSDLLDVLAAMDDPRAILEALTQYNNVNEAKIQRREHLRQKAPAAPNGQRPRMPNGKVDSSLEATRATRALLASKLGGK